MKSDDACRRYVTADRDTKCVQNISCLIEGAGQLALRPVHTREYRIKIYCGGCWLMNVGDVTTPTQMILDLTKYTLLTLKSNLHMLYLH
jgi:hypothetical protein